MLQLLALVKQTRLPLRVIAPTFFHAQYRLKSDKSDNDGGKEKKYPICERVKNKSSSPPSTENKKGDDKLACKGKSKENLKPVCKNKKNESASKSEKKDTECKKEKKAKPDCDKKDETAISGGTKACPKKKKEGGAPAKEKKKQLSCEELLLQREGESNKKKENLKKLAGGSPKCPPKPCPRPPPSYEHANRWKKITLMGVLPVVAILTVLVFSTHKEEERPEFKPWAHMYKRSKPFYFGDGIRSRFHNAHVNALPDGYEDEIDIEAQGKAAETDKEREERLKEFGTLQKDWKKVNDKREAETKKKQAADEKEAKRQQAEAEKEEKRVQAAAEKERKQMEADAEKERKKMAAEAEKERKRQEAEDKKNAKEDTKKVEYSFFSSSKSNDNESDD